jgi:glycosyltransferase involved in cell wall biosynthesis
MASTVSVIIPCFNAQKWLTEAIDSCLKQTYPNLEVIVIDDGSTDGSLETIKSYGNRILWETGPNRGGNYARNRGFALSSGDYIQYLDADDYLLPDKIAKQVHCLQATQADVVYGDWQHQTHLPDGSYFLEAVQVCGPKEDFLTSLLANDRWLSPAALLFARATVDGCGGWDENLKAGQDRDFLIAIALDNHQFIYQPGCDSIYRRHERTTVSSGCKLRWLNSHCLVLNKAEQQLRRRGLLSEKYRRALAQSYFAMARAYLAREETVRDGSNYLSYVQLLEKTLALYPTFRANNRGLAYQGVQYLLGCRRAEQLAHLKSQAEGSVRQVVRSLVLAGEQPLQ